MFTDLQNSFAYKFSSKCATKLPHQTLNVLLYYLVKQHW